MGGRLGVRLELSVQGEEQVKLKALFDEGTFCFWCHFSLLTPISEHQLRPDMKRKREESGEEETAAPAPLPPVPVTQGFTNITLVDLNPNRGVDSVEGVPTDSNLVSLFQQLYNKVLHALYPTIWTLNDKWTAKYRHLSATPKLPKDRTIPNKEGI